MTFEAFNKINCVAAHLFITLSGRRDHQIRSCQTSLRSYIAFVNTLYIKLYLVNLKQVLFAKDLPAWSTLSTTIAPETHLPFPYIDSGVSILSVVIDNFQTLS